MTAIDPAADVTADRRNGARATISPSSLGVFFALEQCQRFLRLALMTDQQRARTLTEAGVVAEQIPPTLSREGRRFEIAVEDALRLTELTTRIHRTDDGVDGDLTREQAPELVPRLDTLPVDRSVAFTQHKMACEVDGWSITGQPDVVVASRDDSGRLSILLCDIKASREPRLEHRLQVALYARMIESMFPDAVVEQGVIYRPPVVPPEGAAAEQIAADRVTAMERLGIDCALLSIAAEPQAYRDMLDRIVFGPDSVARRALAQDLDALPFHVERKCDVCAFNELCLKRCRTVEDLSLVPFLNEQDKRALHEHGVTTVSALAHLPASVGSSRAQLRSAWQIGPRLGELEERAASYLRWQRHDIEADDELTQRGYGTLPPVTVTQHSNLVQIFLDVQTFDPEERVYLLGALVRAHGPGPQGSQPVVRGARSIVRLAGRMPSTDEDERQLLTDWLVEVLHAVRELAVPTERDEARLAPIHLYVYEAATQQKLLALVQRHADAVFGVESLFRLLMQRAAYDTGNVSVLATEIERQWNLPMLCQSLQAVATFRGFKWDAELPLRKRFRHRFFDQLGVETQDDQPLFSPRRSRFKSDLPIEYAYLAWNAGDAEVIGKRGFAPYGNPTLDDIRALAGKRLEAQAAIADRLRPNYQTTKSDFDLRAVLAGSSMRAKSTLEAMRNFVVVERHAVLNGWRAVRFTAPERRVLTGDSLVARYVESDQDAESRKSLRTSAEAYAKEVEAWRLASERGEAKRTSQPEWSLKGVVVKLTLDESALGMDVAQARRRTSLKVGTSVVLAPRWQVDSRLPAAEQVKFASTAKQIMQGLRGRIEDIVETGERSWVEVELTGSVFGSKEQEGFIFSSYLARPLVDGELYTLDEDPNSWSEAHRLAVLSEVGSDFDHPFAGWLEGEATLVRDWPAAATAGQARLLEALDHFTPFDIEPEKRRNIGGHHAAPVLLVQGPPGTGKSFASAYAVLARMQGAMAAGQPLRVAVSCATHAAIDVLLSKIAEERTTLERACAADPDAAERLVDRRLFDVPLIRYQSAHDVAEGKRPPEGSRAFTHAGDPARVNELVRADHVVVGGTPSAIRKLGKAGARSKHGAIWDLCIIDEASQMTAPDALQATFGLKPDGQVVFVGDHRQMPPVIHHAWDQEAEITFDPFAMHRSIFDLVRTNRPSLAQERFRKSFRLHRDVAEYLRREVYRKDDIAFHSELEPTYVSAIEGPALVEAVLNNRNPIVVIVHDERGSQQRNDLERHLVAELYKGFEGRRVSRRDTETTYGVVVPHRAQRAELRDDLVRLFGRAELAKDVDTVERFQGGERTVIVVSATESDPAYLRQHGDFLFDPRRLTVALSRARQKLIVLASRSVFEFLPTDLERLEKTAIWRNLLAEACEEHLWEGDVDGHRVQVFGNAPLDRPPDILA